MMRLSAIRKAMKARKIQFVECESTVLARVGYLREERTLFVVFNHGAQYAYHNVPPKEFQGIIQAWSHGSYFNERVKDKFVYTQL